MISYHKPFPLAEWERELVKLRIDEILQSGDLTNGFYVRLLESNIKELYDVDYIIVVNNCTQGLRLCYSYLPTHTVHIPTFTWDSVVNAVRMSGKNPIFHDINKDTWLMSEEMIEKGEYGIISPNHTFGNVSEVKEQLAIFDGAHALGCRLENIGLATILSLAPTKLVTACEGGVILTNSKGLAEFVIKQRRLDCRESEPNAIIGIQTLTHLKEAMGWKRKVFEYYSKNIPGKFQEVPIESNYNTIGFINHENLIIPRDIETRQYYELQWDDEGKSFPNAYEVFRKMICLPSWFGCDYKLITEKIVEVNK